MQWFCGSESVGFSSSNRVNSSFLEVVGVCRDPLNKNGYFLADFSSIRYFDEAKDQVTLFAGGAERWTEDGVGEAARFEMISSLLIAANGQTLWCSQSFTGGLRSINSRTREVSTVWSESRPSLDSLVWDRARSTLDSDGNPTALYCLIGDTVRGVGRYDVVDQAMSHCSVSEPISPLPNSLLCTQTGLLMFTSYFDQSLILFDPQTHELETLGSTPLNGVCSVALIDSMRVMVVASDSTVATCTLPANCFLLPKCCDRDS